MSYLKGLSLGVSDVVGFEGSEYIIIGKPNCNQENVWKLQNKNPRFPKPFYHPDTLVGFTVVSRAKRDYTIEEFL